LKKILLFPCLYYITQTIEQKLQLISSEQKNSENDYYLKFGNGGVSGGIVVPVECNLPTSMNPNPRDSHFLTVP